MSDLSSRHQKTLEDVFERLTRSSIDWRNIEALLEYLGAAVTEGRGSRVRVALNDVRTVFHRPHPKKEANKSTVDDVRDFLIQAGVKP